jgi:hypothetical protein
MGRPGLVRRLRLLRDAWYVLEQVPSGQNTARNNRRSGGWAAKVGDGEGC